jgi:ParB family chromosome partitioning protein
LKGCSARYHDTLGLTDSVDTRLILPPTDPLRNIQEDLENLTSSIREKGLIEPIVVRPAKGRFEVVVGARRFEACKRLRWSKIPCIIRSLSDQDAFEMSLAENIQRKTMNPVEEAQAFRRYIDERGWGSESALAKKLGKSQEYISQRLSLLSLSKKVKDRIIRCQISPSVAIEIAKMPNRQLQMALSDRAVKKQLTVAVVREIVQSTKPARSWREGSRASEPISSHFDLGYTEPDFLGAGPDRKDTTQVDLEELDNGVNILRLALARLTTLVDSLPQDSDVWEMLAEKRFLIHEMIDSLIKTKVKMARRFGVAIPTAKS